MSFSLLQLLGYRNCPAESPLLVSSNMLFDDVHVWQRLDLECEGMHHEELKV